MSNIRHDTARGTPTKAFFVDMLTRDIDLRDAIFDLIDNCIDGVYRQTEKVTESTEVYGSAARDGNKPYSGYWARITLTQDCFRIEDNCGGIPLETAKQYAFRLGRSGDSEPLGATIGVYGIGMKRAIFKLGREAHVSSNRTGEQFLVNIPKAWFDDENEWNFDMEVMSSDDSGAEAGTTVEVHELREAIRHEFAKKSPFVTELRRSIAIHFAQILDKGFEIYIAGDDGRGRPVKAQSMQYLFDEASLGKDTNIAPYVYRAKIDGYYGKVDVELLAGLTKRAPPVDEEGVEPDSDAGDEFSFSGWTVVCNERVVLFSDRTEATGWGAGLPKFHSQYASFAGVVYFSAADPRDLPLTTTKHGVDANSSVYLSVREKMIEAARPFLRFTNQWKFSDLKGEQSEVFKGAKLVKALDVRNSVLSIAETKKRDGAEYYRPSLPKPSTREDHNAWIRFRKPKNEVQYLGLQLFDDETVKPSEIGEECFDRVLREWKE